jgi:general secretion pathway protein H
MKSAGRRADGFTLLELIATLLLLGLVYALAGPALEPGPTSIEVKAAARQLAAGLRKARGTAIAGHRDAVLTLGVESREFSVSGDPRTYKLPDRIDLAVFTAQAETMSEKTGGIRFFADGSSTGGRIAVSGGTTRLEVDVDWVTGRVKIL